MENINMDATYNRPEGDRRIDSPVLLTDLPSFIDQIKNENAWEKNDRNSITLFKSDKIRIVLVALHRKAEMQTEHPDHVMNIHLLKGKISLIANVSQTEVNKDQMVTLHEKVPYKIKALKKSMFVLTLVE